MTPYNDDKIIITKENAYPILRAFAKEYKRQNGTDAKAEIVIVGGGSILLNYGFREATHDLDVIAQTKEPIRHTASKIAELYNLPDGWLNMDFMHTKSYSEKLREVSSYFCSFNRGNIEFRTVKDEYLIAMKMVSARRYRNDLSDVVGILIYLNRQRVSLTIKEIEEAIITLYGDINCVKEEVYAKVQEYMSCTEQELMEIFEMLTADENYVLENLRDIDKKYPGIITENSLEEIVRKLRTDEQQ